MKCSVFIATSADGYIAAVDGSVDWLHTAGDSEADLGDRQDMGFNDFIGSIDCMVMGRKCMETLAEMNLTPEQWPYGDLPIFVLSNTLREPPENLRGKAEMFSGEIPDLIENLENDGLQHAYVDGGAVITSFLNLKLIHEMTITKAPILLGEGVPLFGKIDHRVELLRPEVVVFPNGFVQMKYAVDYP